MLGSLDEPAQSCLDGSVEAPLCPPAEEDEPNADQEVGNGRAAGLAVDQLNMWTHFCIRTAALAGGKPQGGVTIRTRWVEWPPTDLATPVSPAKSGK